MKNKKDVICLTIMLISIAVITFSITYAYLAPIIGSSAKTNVNIQSGTVDALTFDKCDPINLAMTQSNFTSGGNNLEASTCVKAKLSANNTTNSATATYNVYLSIDENEFVYSTIEESFLKYEKIYKEGNTAEIILQVTDPLGNEITSIEGLPYITQNGISGFDITTRLGLIKIAENYEISVTSTTPKTDEWQIKVILINLETNQSKNADKLFKAEGIIQKETKKDKVVEYIWEMFLLMVL